VAIAGKQVIPNLLALVKAHINAIADVIGNDTIIDWTIPLIKANLLTRG
jgi:hypothetical protein